MARNLARRGDVVVVTVNHRLNALGYLNLAAYGEKYAGSANAGMLDLVLALEWVRGNIANFGGDPGNVMIYGYSGDMSQLLKGAVRGKYARRYHAGTNLILLDPDVRKVVRDERTVNEALRLVIKLRKMTRARARVP